MGAVSLGEIANVTRAAVALVAALVMAHHTLQASGIIKKGARA